jgi:hypothetical protein
MATGTTMDRTLGIHDPTHGRVAADPRANTASIGGGVAVMTVPCFLG